MKLEGGCQCGRVRYTVDDTPFHETVCHCVDCRRSTGAVGVAWFSVKRARLQWSAEPARYRSSATVLRHFCSRCGTTLAYEDETLPLELDLTTGSLDDPTRVPPRDHVWIQQKPGWSVIGDKLPQHGRRRR